MEVAAEKSQSATVQIFKHGPIIIYTRLPAGGTYYLICTSPASSERLIGIFDAFSAFCLRVAVIFPTCSLYPQQKRAYSALHPHTGPCPKALTECSPLDFRRSSIVRGNCGCHEICLTLSCLLRSTPTDGDRGPQDEKIY